MSSDNVPFTANDGPDAKDPYDPALSGPDTGRHSGPDAAFTRVEVERMNENNDFRRATGIHMQTLSLQLPHPPVVSTWICLIAAWLFLGSSIPFTVFIGLPVNIAALVLGAVCLARGGLMTGLLVFILGTIGSLLVYMVGLFKFLSSV